MKILILTVSAGEGHNSTARAVNNVFTENGHQCVTLDICYEANKLLGVAVDKGYIFSIEHLSKLYSETYSKLLEREVGKSDIAVKTANYISKKLRKQIFEYAPDVIVCTHVFCGMVIKPYFMSGELKSKSIGILTDYTLHPYWEEATFLDYIVIPSEELSAECLNKGYKAEQIAAIGIPIQKKFSKHLNKEDARKELGLALEKPVIAVMSGSMCFGGLTETVKAIDLIDEPFQIIAVCGSDKKEFEKLQKNSFRHKVLSFGFTENINVIMDASECIITKPGGISISEAISRELPMILSKAVPGHEERNKQFLISEGVALGVGDGASVDTLLHRFLTDEALRENMLAAAKKISKNNATEKLYELAIK